MQSISFFEQQELKAPYCYPRQSHAGFPCTDLPYELSRAAVHPGVMPFAFSTAVASGVLR
jgi:hypothetical protein